MLWQFSPSHCPHVTSSDPAAKQGCLIPADFQIKIKILVYPYSHNIFSICCNASTSASKATVRNCGEGILPWGNPLFSPRVPHGSYPLLSSWGGISLFVFLVPPTPSQTYDWRTTKQGSFSNAGQSQVIQVGIQSLLLYLKQMFSFPAPS